MKHKTNLIMLPVSLMLDGYVLILPRISNRRVKDMRSMIVPKYVIAMKIFSD
jgi:hypothetical protein